MKPGQAIAAVFVLLAASCSASASLTISDNATPAVASQQTASDQGLPASTAAASDAAPAPAPTTDVDPLAAAALGSPPPATGPIAQLFAAAPDGPLNAELFQIDVTDYDAAFAAVGVDLDMLCTSATAEAYFEAIQRLITPRRLARQGPQFLGLPQTFDEMRPGFGFDFCDINAELLTAGMSSSAPMYHVDRPSAEIVSLASADEQYASTLTTESIGDFTLLDWGDEANVAERTAIRALGRGGQLVVNTPIVARTVEREVADAVADPGYRRIIDRPFVRETLAHLERAGVYSIFMTDRALGPAPTLRNPRELLDARDEERLDELVAQPDGFGLAHWSLLAIGTAERDSDEDDMPISVVVMSHLDPESAVHNAGRLRQMLEEGLVQNHQPWADEIEVLTISAVGSTVVARLASVDDQSSSMKLVSAYSGRDELFALGG